MIWDDLKELLGVVKRRLPGSSIPYEDRLLQMCRGDADCAARLVEHEKQRAPGLTQREACARAIERLAHDR